MKSQIKWVFILMMFVLLSSKYSYAVISLPWSSTFNYGACSQRGAGGLPDCGTTAPDGIYYDWGAMLLNGKPTEVVAAANNPAGGGGNGHRVWVGDGDNVLSGTVMVEFPSTQKEIWVRWYERYQSGFQWNPMGYSKELYFSTAGAGISAIVEPYSGGYAAVAQGTPNYYQVNTSYGWNSIMGGSKSDGLFHCYEVHLKMDTNSANGIGQIWIDGTLRASNTAVNWSNGDSSARNGWTKFEVKSNQNAPTNGQDMYVDFDDMAVVNTTPTNRDAQGNPFIGLIGGGSPVATKLVAPTNLKIN